MRPNANQAAWAKASMPNYHSQILLAFYETGGSFSLLTQGSILCYLSYGPLHLAEKVLSLHTERLLWLIERMRVWASWPSSCWSLPASKENCARPLAIFSQNTQLLVGCCNPNCDSQQWLLQNWQQRNCMTFPAKCWLNEHILACAQQ